MPDWRELGEVPDSEEEDSFDTQDSQLIPELPLPAISAPSQPDVQSNHGDDIWDVPNSSQETQRPDPRSETTAPRPQTPTAVDPSVYDMPDSSPLSSLNSDIDFNSSIGNDVALPQSLMAASLPPPLVDQEPAPRDDVSQSYVQVSSSLPDFTGGDDLGLLGGAAQQGQPLTPMMSQVLGHDSEDQVARQAAIRYERSLRPRKPIQEHPYLLEHAQYNSTLKQHGVRPVRLAKEAQRRGPDQASQDEDFEEESQESRMPGISDESQVNGLGDLFDSLENLQSLTPSPLKTSSLNDRAGPSSQVSSTGDTENTSLPGDDLPALDDLLKQQPRSLLRTLSKRKSSPPPTSVRKRRRHDVVDSDPMEPELAPAAAFRLISGYADSPAAQRNARRSPEPDANAEDGDVHHIDLLPKRGRNETTRVHRLDPPVPQPMMIDSGSEPEEAGPQQNDDSRPAEEGSSSDSSSESGSEIVQTVGRRIRGVLPASWLRLDQQANRQKTQNEAQKRHAERSPERDQRRGVAQRRIAGPGSSIAPAFLFDESDEEESVPQQRTTDDVYHNQTRLIQQTSSLPPVQDGWGSDDGASVVEEDHIDHMRPAGHRQLKLSESLQGAPKRSKPTGIQKKRSVPGTVRQPRITSAFETSGITTTAASRNLIKKKYREPTTHRKHKKTKTHHRPRNSRPVAPPSLSILDVVQPDAPPFLKIAARAARRRRDQGRSSPTRKVIQLATREDHVDAMSVLDGWRAGSIPQRQSVTVARRQRQSKSPKPLGEKSSNARPSKSPFTKLIRPTKKLVKQTSAGETASYRPAASSTRPTRQRVRSNGHLSRSNSGVARPAQLEMDESEQSSNRIFKATKSRLDRLYRKQRGESTASSFLDYQDNTPDTFYPASPPPEENPVPLRIVQEEHHDRQKSRYRKRQRPERIDVEAPQYSRANDPLPAEPVLVPDVEVTRTEAQGEKLRGLGPYGTQYTHHFETFPLDSRVYFHESTLIGSGVLEVLSNPDYSKKMFEPRPRVSFQLGDQTLRWGSWDAQVSSELGAVFDFIAEQLELPTSEAENFDSSAAFSASQFILKYMMDSVCLESATSKIFVSRFLETMKGLDARIASLYTDHARQTSRSKFIASAYDRLLVATLLILKLCQSDASLMAEQFQIEELLKNLTKTSITSLLAAGLDQVRASYKDLSSTRFRDRGIREDTSTIHSWVVVMKVLDFVRIPRASFWDVTYLVMATPEVVSSLDIQEHERLWKNMFTLLPMTEFNDKGIIIPGKRHDAAIDGWTLPQKLLKRVFQVYRDNTRQPPSFNNYCRALVGRCHYLTQQWGWRKCVAIVGVIFDFFGSQNLSHLRNEEVYKSPRFLEELGGNPSLAVEPEDRCFHIFLKLVALSIKKLREVGALKDIRNLVARTLPNHNRQYLKEQNIHERDLAALRNHHDLLCTLFWASPPEIRPAAHIIEQLVVPMSSHKEACLINMRAWNQLARFVIATGEATKSFRPFAQWRNNFFQQMIQQFDSVESDMHQQFLALSKDSSVSISNDLYEAMVAANRAAVKDVLHFSIRASLDVMKHAANLEAATFALNTLQLQQVFRHFAASPPQLDWSSLFAALSTLGVFLSRVEEFKENEESQQSESQILNSAQADDAILVLDHDISKPFFSMARNVLATHADKESSALAAIDKQSCSEQAIVLSARLGVRFMNGLLRLPEMFKNGKYGLFSDVPANLSLDHRKFLTLFVATLLKYGFDDFSNAEFTACELWTLSIVKPRPYLAYENQLAQQLKRHDKEFLPDAVTELAATFDYRTNRDLFEFTVSWMRKSLRDAGPSLRKILLSEHVKTLKAVMHQIKADLKFMVDDKAEHHSYVIFVREIIALIRAHGPEGCKVDDFFYQINKEYSPSMQDPQLQVAGMMSYGVRLSEGETKVVQPLFFLLLNNFKMSLINDKIDTEIKMLCKGLIGPGIRGFVLGQMLPAILKVSSMHNPAFPMLDAYAKAFRLLLYKDPMPYEMRLEDLPHLRTTMETISELLYQFGSGEGETPPSSQEMQLAGSMIRMANDFWPSIWSFSMSPSRASSEWTAIKATLQSLRQGMDYAELLLWMVHGTEFNWAALQRMFGTINPAPAITCSAETKAQIDGFVENMANDLKRNWVFEGNRVMIQAPGKGRGGTATQSSQGVELPSPNDRELVDNVYDAVRTWNYWWKRVFEQDGAAKDQSSRVMELTGHNPYAKSVLF